MMTTRYDVGCEFEDPKSALQRVFWGKKSAMIIVKGANQRMGSYTYRFNVRSDGVVEITGYIGFAEYLPEQLRRISPL